MPKNLADRLEREIREDAKTRDRVTVLTSMIVICEFVDGDGRTWLEEHRNEAVPPWRRNGILQYILYSEDEPLFNYGDEDE